MSLKNIISSLFLFLLVSFQTSAQAVKKKWEGKKCAVVLTYDDALNVHLDKVIPCLDSHNLKGTFYLIGESQVVSSRLEEWRIAAKNGHELGNHSLNHPCDGQGEGRSWVSVEQDLSKYTVERAVNEIRVTNTLLQAIDGKKERTFAFPCGDTTIGNVKFYDSLQNDFSGARGVVEKMDTIHEVNLNDINSYVINGQSAEYMINLVKKAMETGTLVVFLFHGVGGEHSLNVAEAAHQELVQFLATHDKEIWTATLVDVANYVKKNQIAK